MSSFAAPLDQLLKLGYPDWDEEKWKDYRQLGLGPEHVPDLIRMAEMTIAEDVPDEDPSLYAPIHAWRAIGQLGGVEAAPRLLDLLEKLEDEWGDWIAEDFPTVFARIGPKILPAILAFIGDQSRSEDSRNVVTESVRYVVDSHPELRDEAVRGLTEILAATPYDPVVNGFIIAELLEMEAVESATVIEEAFAAERIDVMIAGDWPDIRYELGLGPPPPRQPLWRHTTPGGQSPRARAEERKAQRKRQKKARKRNRKRH